MVQSSIEYHIIILRRKMSMIFQASIYGGFPVLGFGTTR